MALIIADFPKENKKVASSALPVDKNAISSVVKSVDYQGHHLFNVEAVQDIAS